MKYVSPFWSPFADVRKTEMRVIFKITDPNADPNAQFTASASAAGDLEHFLDDVETEKNYPESEPGLWLLNGKAQDRLYGANIGWWSEAISDENAVYDAPPTIDVYFGGIAISTPGTSIDFDPGADSYASLIRITTYDSAGGVIDTGTFENDTPFCVMKMPSNNYYSLKIEFLESKMPQQRVRVSEITFGIKARYDGDKIAKVSLVQAADIAAETLPSAELSAVVDNSDSFFDILAPDNVFAYLQTGKQPVSATVVINGESVSLGKFYYSNAKASTDGLTITLRANDKILTLDKAVATPGAEEMSLWLAVNEILVGTGIKAAYGWGYLENPRAHLVCNAYPENCTKREALRLLAQAARCSCWMDRDGFLRFGLLDVGMPVERIGADELYNFNGLELAESVDAVEVIARQTEDENGEKVENIFVSGAGENLASVNNPCVALSEGQAVADWLRLCYRRRRKFRANNQGDPALDVGDTVEIADAYGQTLPAVMTGVKLTYDGILTAETKATGEAVE